MGPEGWHQLSTWVHILQDLSLLWAHDQMLGRYLLILLYPRTLPSGDQTSRVSITSCSQICTTRAKLADLILCREFITSLFSSSLFSLNQGSSGSPLGHILSNTSITHINFSDSNLNPSGQIFQGTLISTLHQQGPSKTP